VPCGGRSRIWTLEVSIPDRLYKESQLLFQNFLNPINTLKNPKMIKSGKHIDGEKNEPKTHRKK